MLRIRKATKKDFDALVEIWYESSIMAHHFIAQEYWQKNKEAMRTQYLPSAEIYLSVNETVISGFVGLIENYLAALFVLPKYQGKGVGTLLVDEVKKQRNSLRLSVYKKNINGIEFYKSKGFSILSESIDQATKERECVMEWCKLP
ncbi:MAG: N-acetyltransferase [Bacteroidales bacterium]